MFGVGYGCRFFIDMYNVYFIKDYIVCGFFGKVIDDFCEDGRLVEKIIYDYVIREKLDCILVMI